MIIVEVYVDDIIFGSDDDKLSQQFSKDNIINIDLNDNHASFVHFYV